MCQALREELQPHRRGGRGDSCLGSELKGLARLSQLVSLFLRAQTVVSREEEETPASLGVWIPTNFILASAGPNWLDCHFSTPSQIDKFISFNPAKKIARITHASSPRGTEEGQMPLLSGLRHCAGTRALSSGGRGGALPLCTVPLPGPHHPALHRCLVWK